MNTTTSNKTFMYRTAVVLIMMTMLFAVLPVAPASAVSQNITSVSTGTWEATAWPNTLRSGTITATATQVSVVGTGTQFLTELSVGNIIKTTTNTMIGTVASIESDTALTLVNPASTTRTDIAYNVQGVGPADNVTIDATHNVTIAANPVNQAGTVTVNSNGLLTVNDPGTIFSTLIVNGTVDAVSSSDFGELTVNNGGVVNAVGTGSTTAYTATSLTINSGGIINISRNFNVDGATSIAGTVNFSSTSATARAMGFLGSVTLQTGATWNEPASGNGANNTYGFFDDFTNDAAVFITSPTATHSFAGTGKTISGSTDSVIGRANVAGTYTNNGTLSVGNLLSGTGELTNGPTGTLNLGFNVTITTLDNAGTLNKTDAGSIDTLPQNFTNTGTVNLNGTGTVAGITNNAGGIVNILDSGIIGEFHNATATSTLNITDLVPPTITVLDVSTPGNTVDYNGDGNQTVKSMTYSNLVFSGSGDKSITMSNGSTLTTGDLSIAPTGTAKASITGPNLVVNSLTLGGFGKTSGTWGSSASIAANENDTFFALTAGYLNVTTDTRSSQTINFTSTAPTNARVDGPTYTPTASATSGLTVALTIDASAASVCSINAGVVSFHAAGTCVINANQAGNENFMAASQVQQSFTVMASEANIHVSVGGDEMTGSPFTLLAGEGTRKSFLGVSAGPVEIDSDAALVAAERVVFKVNGVGTSFTEMMGLPDSQLDTTYWLPWYNNVELDTQLRFANVSGATATVQVYIGGEEMDGSPFTLLPGASTRKSFAGVSAGPVQIVSDQNIVAAERVVYKVNNVHTSFSEMMALPNGQLDNVYWLPWYNNIELDTQLRFANVSNSTATVHVYIDGDEMDGSPFTLGVGESTRKSFAGVSAGPVKIESDVNIIAAERVVYKVNGAGTSFTEMMGIPESALDTTYWLPWYNNTELDTQLRFANVSGSTATVHIYIGGVEMTGSPFTLLAGESTRKSFAGVNDGPVQIVSDQNIVAAERVVYKVSGIPTSFSEMMGLPASQMDMKYWLPWYNNVELDTQLRFGLP